jgi:hypothetical protein
MATAPGPLIITRWTRQDGRAPAALAPGYAGLDERELPDLLAEAAHFARYVRFVDATGAEDGDWGEMLAADPAVYLAQVATFRFEGDAATIRRFLPRLREQEDDIASRERVLRNVERILHHLMRSVDRWIDESPGGSASPLANLVEHILAPHFRRLHRLFAAIDSGGFVEERFAIIVYPFQAGWRLSQEEAEAIAWDVERVWIDSVAEPLASAAEAFLAGLDKLKAQAGEALAARLAEGDHPPHIGLLIAFLELFGHEQARLNAILPRLARYYHERMVGAAPRPPRPDRTLLAFTRAAATGPAPRISAGHLFEAKPAGSGVAPRFAADFALTVTGAKVEELRLWQAATNRVGLQVRTKPDEAAVAEAFALQARSPLPDAPAGLIVAGPALRAESGLRRFRVDLDLAGLAWPAAAPASGFAALLGSAFEVAVLTEEGWHVVAGAHSEGAFTGPGAASAAFSFSLSPDAPGIAAAAPAIRFVLRQGASPTGVAPLPVFADARVVRIAVELTVEDLDGLAFSTNAGAAASPAGLAPFGAPAVRGGWLEIRHPVLERGVDRLALTLRWAEPPPHPDGFHGYYREYVVDLDRTLSRRGIPLFRNDVFRVTLEATGAGGADDLPLFPQAEPEGPVGPSSLFELTGPADGERDPRSGASGVRLTLTAPEHAFGDLLYPSNVLYASQVAAGRAKPRRRRHPILVWLAAVAARLRKLVSADEKLWQRLVARFTGKILVLAEPLPKRPALPAPGPAVDLMPNPPWRPMLAGLRLDYRARFELLRDGAGGEDLSVGHWTPLGTPVGAEWRGGVRLLPALPDRPCFDLLLSGGGAADDGLSLLILVDSGLETPPVSWLEQAGEGEPWRPASILDDRTRGLTRSGLVRLANNPHRLRAVSSGPLPRVEAILPDALSATRVLSGGDDAVEPLPPGAIAKVSGAKGVAAVRQPLASSGGCGAGSGDSLATRAGERLRHKERAILAWDDERLALDRFPEIERIRVLPARGRDGAPSPGSVLALVIPAGGGEAQADGERPRTPTWLLRAIEAELSGRAPMSATIAAVSPAYAPVDIRAKVALAGSGDPARLEAEIRAFLSPCAREGPDLPDTVGTDDLSAALVRFIRSRPYVLAVAEVAAALAPRADPALCVVPVAGALELEVLTLESFGA